MLQFIVTLDNFLNKESNLLFSASKIMLSDCGMYLIRQKIQR